MNKEEILAQSRKENEDEGFDYAQNKGNYFGLKAICALVILFIITNMVNRHKTLTYADANYSVLSLFWGYLGFQQMGIYQFTKKKSTLVTAILAILASVIGLFGYMIEGFF
ncbi:DUF6442 family protein [Scatolibacter rhodanostii]|uniref:DUF6442 family protein n=1 Tax=Scatolibacter rhodanostii TaxID=2014781 RepID=UPI000C084AD7|nr:DUF6442 family protein [Scatolibacter rhodanostii]